MGSCGPRDPGLPTLDPMTTYHEMVAALDQEHPGRGRDIFNDTIKDRAMAYALVLRAEALRYTSTQELDALVRMRRCADWLMENDDLNGDGIPGYGLADPWDAFGDGTVNPPYQEYIITTAMCIEAMQDKYEADPDTTGLHRMRRLVLACVDPFLDTRYDGPNGMLAYSRNPNDAGKDVFNSSIYLAGQLQRASTWAGDSVLSIRLAAKATAIMGVLEAHAHSSPTGGLFWHYAIAEKSAPNDLLHASYIAEGIREYQRFGGDRAIDVGKVMAQFADFHRGGYWYEQRERNWQKDPFDTRLWSLGQLMYTLAQEGEVEKMRGTLWPQLCQYHLGDGHFMFKRADQRALVRHEAHLLLGLGRMLFGPGGEKAGDMPVH